jgi:hypothetical protein
MPSYEARQCEGSNNERWRIYVNGVCDHSLGEFSSQPEAEAVVRQLILREKVLAIDASAKFEVPVPAQNRSYFGPVVAMIYPSEDCGCGVAQKSGRSLYALHTKKEFATVMPQDASITVEYHNGEVKVIPPKTKERGGNER